MIISRAILTAVGDRIDPYEWHRLLWPLFPVSGYASCPSDEQRQKAQGPRLDRVDGTALPMLFRVDERPVDVDGDMGAIPQAVVDLRAFTTVAPSWSPGMVLRRSSGEPAFRIDQIGSKPAEPLRVKTRYAFTCRASLRVVGKAPSKDERGPVRIVDRPVDAELRWMDATWHANAKHGFIVESAMATASGVTFEGIPGHGQVGHPWQDIRGTCVVQDVALAEKTRRAGIGRGRHLGLGLLWMKPA